MTSPNVTLELVYVTCHIKIFAPYYCSDKQFAILWKWRWTTFKYPPVWNIWRKKNNAIIKLNGLYQTNSGVKYILNLLFFLLLFCWNLNLHYRLFYRDTCHSEGPKHVNFLQHKTWNTSKYTHLQKVHLKKIYIFNMFRL